MVVGSSGYGECREDQGRLGLGGNETGSNMWSAMLYVWYVHVKPEDKAIQLFMFYNNSLNLAFYSFIHIFLCKNEEKTYFNQYSECAARTCCSKNTTGTAYTLVDICWYVFFLSKT